jgi:hypothetical protein
MEIDEVHAKMQRYKVESLASHTPAHNNTATVAPFQAWRNLQIVIAEGPTKLSITTLVSVNDSVYITAPPTSPKRKRIMENLALSFKSLSQNDREFYKYPCITPSVK